MATLTLRCDKALVDSRTFIHTVCYYQFLLVVTNLLLGGWSQAIDFG